MVGRRRQVVPVWCALAVAAGCLTASPAFAGPGVSPRLTAAVASTLSDDEGAAPDSEGQGEPLEPVLLEDETTESSQTWQLPDGSFKSVLDTGPVRFQDALGEWQPIDNQLVESDAVGVAVENAAGDVSVLLPQDASERAVKVADDGAWVSFALEGLDGAPSVDGATATYADAGEADEVRYEASSSGVKESIVLNESPAADADQLEFQYVVRASAGLNLRRGEQGSLEAVNGAGEVRFTVPAPYMTDSAATPAVSTDVSYGLSRTGDSSWVVTVTPSMAWLSEPGRVVPLVIDPTVTNQTLEEVARECWISEYWPTSTMCYGSGSSPEVLKVGVDSAKSRRALLRFNIDSVPASATNVAATLKLYLESSLGSTARTYRTRRVDPTWSVQSSWVNRNSTTAWTAPGGDAAGTTPPASTIANGSGWRSLNATYPMREWLAGATNNGLLVKQETEAYENLLTFTSAKGDAAAGTAGSPSSVGPKLEVTYDDLGSGGTGLGDRGFYQFTTEQLSDRMSAKVNIGSGNLLLTAGDVNVAGVAGLNLAFNRYYNSRATSANDASDKSLLGPGWSTNLGGSVRLEGPTGTGQAETVYYWGASRFRVRYDRNAIAGGYARSAPGGAGKLTWNSTTSTYELTGRDKQVQVFNNTGQLTKVRDKQGNELVLSYNGDGSLQQVVDTRGRKMKFSYSDVDSGTGVAVRMTAAWVESATGAELLKYTYTYQQVASEWRLSSSYVSAADSSLVPSGGDVVNVGASASTEYSYYTSGDAAGKLATVSDARRDSGTTVRGTTQFSYLTGSTGQVSAMSRLTDDTTTPDSTSTFTYVSRSDQLPTYCSGDGNHATTVDGERLTPADVDDTTKYCLDEHERVLRVIDAKDHKRKTSWTASSNVATFDGSGTGTASLSASYQTSYDGKDNPTRVQTPTGGIAKAAYTDTDNNPTMPTATAGFDTGGDLTSPTWEYDYDDKGNLIEAKSPVAGGYGDADDVTYRYCWDGKGQLQRIDPVTTTGAAAMSTTLDTDINAGCGTSSQGNDTLFSYNTLGELTGVNAPGANRDQTMTYDALSRVKTVTDARGVTTTYYYDALDHVVEQTFTKTGSTSATVRWDYDATGNTLKVSDPSNTSNGDAFIYDELNRPVQQDSQAPLGWKQFEYDPADNLVGIRLSDFNGKKKGQSGWSSTTDNRLITYAYDAVNLMTSASTPVDPNGPTTFGYDRHDKLTRTTWPMPSSVSGGSVVRQVRYNDAGQITCVFSHRSGTTALDSLSEGSACPSDTAAGLLTFQAYNYNKTVGSVTFKTQTRWSMTEKGSVVTTYDYDPLSRLKTATVKKAAGSTIRSHHYTYDRHSSTLTTQNANYPGNGATMPGMAAGITTMTYSDNDELCWSVSGTSALGCGSAPSTARLFEYDGAGALTKAGVLNAAEPLTLTYNLIGQATSIDPAGPDPAVSMGYVGVMQDRRVAKDDLGMSYGFNGLTAQATNSGIPHTDHYLRSPGGTLIKQFNVNPSNGNSNGDAEVYYLTDAQNTVVATIDTTGKVRRYAYEPYGRQIRTWIDTNPYSVTSIGSAGLPADGSYNTPVSGVDDDPKNAQPWRYASGYYDAETGMLKFGTRYYMPDVTRWTQTDPVAGKLTNPITMNPYNYVGSSPIRNTDPTGRHWLWEFVEAGWEAYSKYDEAASFGAVLYDMSDGDPSEMIEDVLESQLMASGITTICAGGIILGTGGIGTPGSVICGAIGQGVGTWVSQQG